MITQSTVVQYITGDGQAFNKIEDALCHERAGKLKELFKGAEFYLLPDDLELVVKHIVKNAGRFIEILTDEHP